MFLPKVAKPDNTCQRYHENKKGSRFLKHSIAKNLSTMS